MPTPKKSTKSTNPKTPTKARKAIPQQEPTEDEAVDPRLAEQIARRKAGHGTLEEQADKRRAAASKAVSS